jgi:peptide-O-fucosyltransferase
LYGVNPGEGFNLRRDVHMRAANLVRQLRERGHNFVLVLPPWGGLYHWQSRNIGEQARLRWSLFFDVASMQRFVPTIELEDWLAGARMRVHTLSPSV